MKVAGGKKQWLTNVTVFTLAGGAASAFVGAALGTLGRILLPVQVGARGALAAIVIALIAIARELGWLPLPFPQWRRQTRDVWGKVFPGPLAAALWGFDLGLAFTTWLTFSGIWLLVAVVILAAAPVFGAALFTLYWLGRALSVWFAPLLLPEASATPQLLRGITQQYRLLRQIHVWGLAWAVVVLIAGLIRGIQM